MAGKRPADVEDHDENTRAFMNSNGGPYIYDHGKLKQSADIEQELKDHEMDCHSNIRMDNHHYEIEVIFEVAATAHNYERGNLYLQSQFNSFKSNRERLIVARSGFLNPRGSVKLFITDLVQTLPLIGYILHSDGPTEEVHIKIFDLFDNHDFGL